VKRGRNPTAWVGKPSQHFRKALYHIEDRDDCRQLNTLIHRVVSWRQKSGSHVSYAKRVVKLECSRAPDLEAWEFEAMIVPLVGVNKRLCLWLESRRRLDKDVSGRGIGEVWQVIGARLAFTY
jgi:hypothetical protein